jgi:cobalt-precorrin 5A hydrolase
MTIGIISLSQEGARVATKLAHNIPDSGVWLHAGVTGEWNAKRFTSVYELTAEIFTQLSGLIYVGPCGVAVRSVAPHLKSKKLDPAVVVVDALGRWSVSLISGHEGGANDLALKVANILSAEPVITTTTEALKSLIVGIGCRKGTQSDAIIKAIRDCLDQNGLELTQVRLLSSADVKASEKGLLVASRELEIPLRIIASEEIKNCAAKFEHSEFVQNNVGLPAVAEPAALLAGRRTKLIIRKRIFDGITIAVARESSL